LVDLAHLASRLEQWQCEMCCFQWKSRRDIKNHVRHSSSVAVAASSERETKLNRFVAGQQ